MESFRACNVPGPEFQFFSQNAKTFDLQTETFYRNFNLVKMQRQIYRAAVKDRVRQHTDFLVWPERKNDKNKNFVL